MSLPDYRIKLPATRIDFPNTVGETGQDHDLYPAPGAQARYDHLRSYLIGLLTHQASHNQPTQYREGTLWFDLNDTTLKVRKNDLWVALSSAIALEPDLTLLEWYETAKTTLTGLTPEVVFSGKCVANNISNITIPNQLSQSLYSDSRVFLHINGSLVDPNNCALIGTPPTTVKLSTVVLSAGDVFTISIRRINNDNFLTSSIIIP